MADGSHRDLRQNCKEVIKIQQIRILLGKHPGLPYWFLNDRVENQVGHFIICAVIMTKTALIFC